MRWTGIADVALQHDRTTAGRAKLQRGDELSIQMIRPSVHGCLGKRVACVCACTCMRACFQWVRASTHQFI